MKISLNKVPEPTVPITVDVSLTEKPKPFYMVISTWRLRVLVIRPIKTTFITTPRKYFSVFIV